MKAIKAIETIYKGYRFRSRLEARWAVFFDTLNLDWEYEPEGFDLDGVWYLPDFRINYKGAITWYEVKPKHIATDNKFELFEEMMIAKSLDDATKGQPQDLVDFKLLSGDPLDFFGESGACKPGLNVCPRCGNAEKGEVNQKASETLWGCFACDVTSSSGIGDTENGKYCLIRTHKGWVLVESEKEIKKHFERIKYACDKARAARFEHGEQS